VALNHLAGRACRFVPDQALKPDNRLEDIIGVKIGRRRLFLLQTIQAFARRPDQSAAAAYLPKP
jgi:hypothetical protein